MKDPARHATWYRAVLAATGLALSASLVGLAGCGGEELEPVARLAVEPARLELPYGSFTDLRFTWTPLAAADGPGDSARVFLHLVDSDGDLVRTFDHDPAWRWQVGQELSYDARVYQSLLAPPLPPGTYSLTAGLYDPEGGRWALETGGEDTGRSEYRVATVEVPERTGDASRLPAVQFTPSWSPTLAGSDRQVIAYRWLAGEGSIRLEDLPGPGTAWLSVGIPREGADLRRRIVDPPEGGDGVPRVDLAASCSGFEAQVSGEGTHAVEVPVEAAEGGCEITLDPNFVVEASDGVPRSLVLEVLAWRAPAP